MKTNINTMYNIKKTDVLRTVGSAPNIEALKTLILSKLLWSRCDIIQSETKTICGKPCYDVYNGKGIINHFAVTFNGKRARLHFINTCNN